MSQSLLNMEHKEWLEWRRKGIGATDACVVMGVSPWKTVRQLWEEKVYGNTVHLENSSMKRGKDLEPHARAWFESTMNVSLSPQNRIHSEYEWLRASLDGIDDQNKIMVEIKCPNKDDHFVAINKKVPEKYWPQVQHQLLVTGLENMFYCSYNGKEGTIVEVERDNSYINSMFEEEKKFWDMVLRKEPPELLDNDFVCMDKEFSWEALAVQWSYVSSNLKSLESEERSIREKMIALSENRNAFGSGVKISKSICPGTVDYKKCIDDYITNMKAHYPDIEFPEVPYEAYRKNSFNKWTFRAV